MIPTSSGIIFECRECSKYLFVGEDNYIQGAKVTLNGVEKPFSKYVLHVWEGCSFADYKTLVSKSPNDNIKNNVLYKDYKKKLKSKNETELCNAIIEREKEKILYFILAFPQKTIVVKS